METTSKAEFNPARFKNTILRHLSSDIIEHLHLTAVALPIGRPLEEIGNTIKHLYFVEEGVGSMTTAFKDGSEAEVSMFGYESVIGVSALMGTKRSLNRIYMQIEGRGFSCPTDFARKEFSLGGEFQRLCLRYVQVQLTQLAQSAGCGVKHTVDQRLARWLLITSDRARSDNLKFSQEFLGSMLGSKRTSVSLAAHKFKLAGLVDYRHGMIQLLDKPRLQQRACECYAVVKDHLDNYTEFDTGFVV
ncbi:Crp/Fnr family transcriptional regulator [Terriglobus saanensis]|uniref:Putative transcriptional regulator, Crp/Fnr family n=1 Tax=Terriglobus saanensis (strain ATCC BAA-1853 / DSM 23119 / SP1PR4) TaxID=401053 RepID=E8V5B5_TERSS|nr:Crp/Fnr family transcriptional regulator [Terriglobus saanensis]ADV84874.1 putative transcriptional regulator, Crp/Fnr family [Terriglobus saanensis SP1PR4]